MAAGTPEEPSKGEFFVASVFLQSADRALFKDSRHRRIATRKRLRVLIRVSNFSLPRTSECLARPGHRFHRVKLRITETGALAFKLFSLPFSGLRYTLGASLSVYAAILKSLRRVVYFKRITVNRVLKFYREAQTSHPQPFDQCVSNYRRSKYN